jgi:energy-coupling factor transporter ATP-binding protein EcfA2
MTAITAFCTQSSVVVVVGKGGVGKSTLSATVARLAARNGVSVLLVELESRSRPSGVFGGHVLTADEVELSAGDRGSQSARIRARTITPEDALVEYLVDHGFGRAARRLAQSGMLDVAATAIPGLRDILVLGKIVQLERAHTSDLIVVDGPAAGHATTLLTSAHGLLDSSRAGPIHAQAADVVGFLSDRARCQVVLVTLAEETPVNETVETALTLQDGVGMHLGPVIVNCLYQRLDHLDADPEAAAAAAGVILRPGEADAIRAAAAFRRRRQEMQAEQATRLAEALPLPQLWLPHLFAAEIGRTEIDLLVDAMETGLIHLREPASRAGWTSPTKLAPGIRVPGNAAAGMGWSS